MFVCAPPFQSSRPIETTHSLLPRSSWLAPTLAGLWLPGTVHVLNFREELGGTDVDFLVGAVQQAQCSDLVGGGHVVSGCFGFLAAERGLEGCDFGGLLE